MKERADLSSGPLSLNLFERSSRDPGLPGTPFGLGGGMKSSSSISKDICSDLSS